MERPWARAGSAGAGEHGPVHQRDDAPRRGAPRWTSPRCCAAGNGRRVWPSLRRCATSRERYGTQHHAQNARAGARGDTRAELARRARRPAPRGEFTHAQERAVMAAGLARAQVSRAGRWLPGAYLGQLQTQLHAGAAGGWMDDRARLLAPVAPADTVA